jgi:hypothetical protein
VVKAQLGLALEGKREEEGRIKELKEEDQEKSSN